LGYLRLRGRRRGVARRVNWAMRYRGALQRRKLSCRREDQGVSSSGRDSPSRAIQARLTVPRPKALPVAFRAR